MLLPQYGPRLPGSVPPEVPDCTCTEMWFLRQESTDSATEDTESALKNTLILMQNPEKTDPMNILKFFKNSIWGCSHFPGISSLGAFPSFQCISAAFLCTQC